VALTSARKALLAFSVLQLVIFVVSLPGVGIETRKFTQYASWAGPLFLVLTVLVFALGLGTIATVRRPTKTAANAGAAMAIFAAVTNILDFSHLGGPPPSPGPLYLGIASLVVAILQLLSAARVIGQTGAGPPPPWTPPDPASAKK
jgi:hypothetical protein